MDVPNEALMTGSGSLRSLAWALAATTLATAADAAAPDPVKVGVIVPTSGPFASIGGRVLGLVGFAPSRKNPLFCNG